MNKYIVRPVKYLYFKLIRQSGSSEQIARGVAAGSFVGFLLPPGLFLQIIIGAFISKLIKGNQVATYLGTWVSNPFTVVPMTLFYIKLGSLLTGIGSDFVTKVNEGMEAGMSMFDIFKEQGSQLVIVYFTASLLCGLISIPFAYYTSKSIVVSYRKKRSERLEKRREKLKKMNLEG